MFCGQPLLTSWRTRHPAANYACGMPTHSVTITRTSLAQYRATNANGATLDFGSGDPTRFSPVELLLAAIGGCSSVDVDHMTSRRAEPEAFDVVVSGTKSTEGGNRMTDLEVTFRLRFPEGAAGDAARARVPAAVKASHDSACTVSRTIELGAPVAMTIESC